jgi:prepilin-type N-terminal cleavage/methylation domain-containing protein
MATWRRKRGFTLIELLVVIAIIGLLISILLPSLRRAREESRTTVCLSNLKQLTQSFFLYAEEYGSIPGAWWQGPIDCDWSGYNNAKYRANPDAYDHPMETSVLFPFMSRVDEILECPTAQRLANKFYDYTMIIRMAGARTDLPWKMTYPSDMSDIRHSRLYFPAIPFLIEEDAYFWNEDVPDGSWANIDQISDRHHGAAHLGYLDGSAGQFVSPKGGNPEADEQGDMKARHLRFWDHERPYRVWFSSAGEFGWANRPR